MPLRDFDNNSQYEKLCQDLDSYIAQAVEKYIHDHHITVEAVIEGWNDLVPKLRSGQDPNYNLLGSPVAYAFQFLPKKITAMLGVFNCWYKSKEIMPRRVLDIGAGTNAVAIALGFAVQDDPVEVVALEPSAAMRNFTHFEEKFSNISVQSNPNNVSGLIEDIVLDYKQGKYTQGYQFYHYFDTITVSSALAYYFSNKDELWWRDFSNALTSLSTEKATLIIVEPYTKSELLKIKIQSASKSGWVLDNRKGKLLSEMLPNISKKELPLNELTKLQKKYINWYDVTSWNMNPNYQEHILLFHK